MRPLTKPFIAVAVFSPLAVLFLGACSGESNDSTTTGNDVPVAYVKRPTGAFSNPTDSVNSADGGDLYVREKSSPSSPEVNITGSYTNGAGDVSDPEVSYDGTRLLFAMRCSAQSSPSCYNYRGAGIYDFSWNIWEYDLRTRQMRRLIDDSRVSRLGNDVDPAYLPGSKIVFTSTRQATTCNPQTSNSPQPPAAVQCAAAGSTPDAVGYLYTDEYEREPVTVLHVMNDDGTDIKQISFNQSHDRNPTVLDTGEIMYARWDHVGGRNQFSIFKINPDGTDYFVLYGAHSPGNSYLHPRPMPDGRVITSLMPLSGTREGGSLEIIDVANYSENNEPAEGVGVPNQLGRREGQFQASRLMNTGASDSEHTAMRGMGVSPLGRYTTPYPLFDGTNRVLVAYTPSQPVTENNAFVGTRTVEGAPQYGIWMLNMDRGTLSVVVPPQAGYLFSDPVAIQPRPEPAPKTGSGSVDPTLAGEGLGLLNVKSVYDTDGRGRMGSAVLAAGESIPQSGGRPDLNAMKNPANTTQYPSRVARFFRITKAVPTPAGLDRETIGEEEFEMQQIVGYGVIEPDGSMTARVPANTPVSITALDREGRGFTHHTNWIQARPGETRTCNGCHSPRRGAALNGTGVANNHPLATPGASESMSETRVNNNQAVDVLRRDPSYTDFWTGVYNTAFNTNTTPESDIAFSYDGASGLGGHGHAAVPSPVRARNDASCDAASWNPVNCAIVINYETHIQPIWDQHCVSCHNGAAPAGDLDLSDTRSAVMGRLVSYQELLVGDPIFCTNPASTTPPCTVGLPIITINEDGEIRIQREPSLVNAGNSRSSTLIERLYEQELLAAGTACGGSNCTNHAGMLNAAEKRLVSEWADIGAQYYNDPFDGSGNVRSARNALSRATFDTVIAPILLNNPTDPVPGAGCAGCHRAFGGNGTSTGPANPTFAPNRYVLTGNLEGDFNATASMVTDVCAPDNSYLLLRPRSTLSSNPPHPGTGTSGTGPAVLPQGTPMYDAIYNWINAARGASGC